MFATNQKELKTLTIIVRGAPAHSSKMCHSSYIVENMLMQHARLKESNCHFSGTFNLRLVGPTLGKPDDNLSRT